jgi:peptide/nickel transport system ATP-binding protein
VGAGDAALEIRALRVTYAGRRSAVLDVSLDIPAGECLALVGESGSGKSTIALAVLGLLPRRTEVTGSITLAGRELVGAGEKTLRAVRGRGVGYVAQDPMQTFDPLRSVGSSVSEAWRVHDLRAAADAIPARLSALGIDRAATRARHRPHQWSGGMLQRASIAASAAHHPAVIVADEPTSALDADRADAVLESLRSTGAAILLISHDLALVGRHSDEVAVLYAGRLVERGLSSVVLAKPRHPYTAALLAASPRPGAGLPTPIPGSAGQHDGSGCAFAPRCERASDACRAEDPELTDGVACWHPRTAAQRGDDTI